MKLTFCKISSLYNPIRAFSFGGITSASRFSLALYSVVFLGLASVSSHASIADDTAAIKAMLETWQTTWYGPNQTTIPLQWPNGYTLGEQMFQMTGYWNTGSRNLAADFDTLFLLNSNLVNSSSANVAGISNLVALISTQHDFLINYLYPLSETVQSSASAVDGSSPTLSVHDAVLGEDVRDILDVLQGLSLDLQTINSTVEDGFTSTNVPPGSPRPPDYSSEIQAAEDEAASVEYRATQSMEETASNNVPVWVWTQDIPGNLDPISNTQIDSSGASSFTPNNSGIPLLGQAVVTSSAIGGITLPTYVVEVDDNPGFRVYVRPWMSSFDSFMNAIWTLLTAFAVALIVRREWKFYMGIGSQQESDIASHAEEMEAF